MSDQEKLMRQGAAQTLSNIDELMAGIREGNEDAIQATREMLHGMINSSDGVKLAAFLLPVKAMCESVLSGRIKA